MNSFGVDVNWLRRLKGGWRNSLGPTFLAEVKSASLGYSQEEQLIAGFQILGT